MKYNNKKLKDNMGITLVTLVITIVIIIILASVTINAVLGDNGLIKQSQKTSEIAENTINKEQEETNRLMQEHANVMEEDKEKPIESKILTLVDMFEKAKVDRCTNEDGTCENPDHLHIGDYVNYQNPTSGTYTITAEKSGLKSLGENVDQTYDIAKNQLNWRVLEIDQETGGLKLLAGSPMKLNVTEEKTDPYLYLYGAEAYVYGADEIDNVGEMYVNEYSYKARSVNIDDIKQILKITTEEQIKEYNVFPIKYNWKQYGEIFNLSNQYTPESWLGGQQQTTVSGNVTGYSFEITNETEGIAALPITNTRAKNMLFDNIEINTGKAYWLSSKGTLFNEAQEFVSFGLYCVSNNNVGLMNSEYGYSNFVSIGAIFGVNLSVRPVVILKPDITKEQVGKIADKVEETWN